MPGRKKQLAVANKAAARAARAIERAITALTEEIAALPKVSLDDAAEQVAHKLYLRNREAYYLLDGMT